ncbi:S9 family peptidase [Oxalobacteraceae bacterium OM1]|nr:S9 family peptidase [Oxalobacteraceae bacterium OM1]
MRKLHHLAAGVLTALAALVALVALGNAHAQSEPPDDPYRWLEDVGGERPLAWVKERNAVALKELQASPQYAPLLQRFQAVLDSRDRIPAVVKHGAHLYNFWRDPEHVRGIWRRTTLTEFRKPQPKWETVIDLDRLARDENENWVWHEPHCLPHSTRCLIALSRGGGDAQVMREFDTAAGRFVDGGFTLPEAKSDAVWRDRDTLLVSTDFGPGSMTTSGYPRTLREWKRGTPLSEATLVYEAQDKDMAVSASKDYTQEGYEIVERRIGFYSGEAFLRRDGKLVRLDKPDDAVVATFHDQLLLKLRSDWNVDGKVYPQGGLVAIGMERFLQGARDFELLFVPTPTRSLSKVVHTRGAVLLNELDNVKSRVTELRRVQGKWVRRAVATPEIGSVALQEVDELDSDDYFMQVAGFLTPDTLYLGHAGSDAREKLKSLPAFFDAATYTVAQYEATSKDGTRVPYFVVMRKDTKFDGSNPTVLYGYGGFEIAMKPTYSGIIGGWLDSGGVYVLANIRGGGEFGPRWHQAALKENRQRAYDDFIAVGEDLVTRKLTAPKHLGIMGGSNGGLLVGAVMVQRPDLFNGVVCQVPLLDMYRYSHLLAGASWMGEYGDPDDPQQWAYISKYSPYQNVAKEKHYPRVLFTTSTRDDRVHPAHARKMVARMLEQGHDVLYWENTEGGHAGAANNAQRAQMWALTYTFLQNQLR